MYSCELTSSIIDFYMRSTLRSTILLVALRSTIGCAQREAAGRRRTESAKMHESKPTRLTNRAAASVLRLPCQARGFKGLD